MVVGSITSRFSGNVNALFPRTVSSWEGPRERVVLGVRLPKMSQEAKIQPNLEVHKVQ